MRFATFNLENLFERPKVMNLADPAEGKPILEDHKRLNDLIQEPIYSDEIKDELLEIMKRNKGLLTNGVSKYIRFRQIRGKLLFKPQNKPVDIVATGRTDWIGWFELITEPVKATATENTGRVIGLLNTDVLCVIEAENRVGLKRFNDTVLERVGVLPFDHTMLIDGNDDRGIDVGIVTRRGFEIVGMLSHVDDVDDKGTIFSRDCAEYEIDTPSGNKLLLMVNHFKSKGFGSFAESTEKRLRQATRVREIYDERLKKYDHIAVLGDLNETPDKSPMDPLIRQGSNLTDVMVHPKFVGDGREGTFGNGAKSAKLDYILMSPKLSDKVTLGGIERKGVWGGKNGDLFAHLPEIKSPEDAASDHAALFVEVDL